MGWSTWWCERTRVGCPNMVAERIDDLFFASDRHLSIDGSHRDKVKAQRCSNGVRQEVSALLRGTKRDFIFLLAIFCLAAALRVLLVLTSPPPPTAWIDGWIGDEDIYLNAAQGVLAVARSGADLAQVVYQLAERGPVYPLYLALIYGVFGSSHLAVGIMQALLDAAGCTLIYLVGRQVLDRIVGILAAGIAIFYTPFILSSGRLLRETLASFLLLLVVLFFTKAVVSSSAKMFLLSGVSLGLTLLCNSAAQYLAVFLLVVMLLVSVKRRPRNTVARHVFAFLIGPAILVGSWMTITAFTIGEPLMSATASMDEKTGGFLNNIYSDGWMDDGYPRSGAFRRKANELLEGRELTPEERRELVRESAGFRLQVAANIVAGNPSPDLVIIPVKNFFRLWQYPYNTFLQAFVLSYRQQVLFHRAIVLLGLIGIPLSLALDWRRSAAIMATLAYFSLIWMATKVEARYNMALMPYVIVMAALALHCLIVSGRKMRGDVCRRAAAASLGVSLGLGSLWLIASPQMLLSAFATISALSAHCFSALLGNLLLISLVPLLYLVGKTSLDARRSCFIALFPILVLLVGYNLCVFTTESWHVWRTRLSKPAQRVHQEILLPDDFELSCFVGGSIVIDMLGGPSKSYDLIIEVNDQQIQHYEERLRVDVDEFDFYHKFYSQLMTAQNRQPEDLRQWFEIPVDLSLLANTDRVTVDVYLTGDSEGRESYVDVYGDYVSGSGRIFEGPSFALARSETSLYKYLFDDDFRLVTRTPLESPYSSSAFYDGSSWLHTDLSPQIGVQSGEFRIRVKLLRQDGTVAIL